MTKDDFPPDRLTILRETDLERRWYTVDDKRVCLVCEQVISGREIGISGEPGSYQLSCPTAGCPGTFPHWLLLRFSGSEAEEPGSSQHDIGSFFFPSAEPNEWKILGEEGAA